MGMRNYFLNHCFLAITCLTIVSSSCSSHIAAPKIAGSSDSKIGVYIPAPQSLKSDKTNQAEINLEQEAGIEKLCVEAWRSCLAGKQKEALAQLQELSKKYPSSSSVLFMTGQVLDKCGKKEEAAIYYEKSMHDSDFAVMSLYKLAESLRTAGSTTKAVARYKELVKIAPNFPQAHLGLAKALRKQNPKAEQANGELNKVLALDPDNKEAKALLR
jgi:tetratricopeptide (TPR) repeat protein